VNATLKTAVLSSLAALVLVASGCGQQPAGQPASPEAKSNSKPAASAPAVVATNSAKINGANWQGDDKACSFKTGITDKGGPALFVKVVKGDPNGKYEGFSFSPACEPKVGEYKLDGNTCQYHRSEPSDDTFNASSGTLKITQADAKHLEGTFALEAKSWDNKVTIKVTDGTFNVQVTQ
jgi:hypothetical protein